MLFTRCPECDTTFRVTDETLKKASGQVRCGRCASVFNAYAELHDPAAKTFEPEPAPPRATDETPAAPPPAPSAAAAEPPAQTEPPPAPPPAPAESEPAAEDAAISIAAQSVADIVKEAAAAADEASVDTQGEEPAPDAQAISASEVDRVLAAEPSLPLPQTEYT